MYILRRKVARTEGPQPVYKAVVDQTVRTWMPAAALLLACAVTPGRAKLDVRNYDWGQSVTFVPPLVDAKVRTWQPAATTELASFRTAARPTLDVRLYEWINGWGLNVAVTPPTAAQRWPAILQGTQPNYQTTARRALDVRSYAWSPDSAWQSSVQVPPITAAQRWPALLLASGLNYRTPSRPVLDVRQPQWAVPDSAWISAALFPPISVAQSWPAVHLATGQSYSTRSARPSFDVRLNDGSGGSFGVPLDQSEAWQSACETNRGDTPPARLKLDVRRYEWLPEAGWLFSALPPTATIAQTWPAVFLGTGTNYRTPSRPVLDVWRADWDTTFGLSSAIDTAVRAWMPAIAGGALASQRTRDGIRLEVRTYPWSPDSAWLFTAQPPAIPVAQSWPAIWLGTGTQYQTAKRGVLDVRAHDWDPTFGIAQVVDAKVAPWLAAIGGDHGGRTTQRLALDVRSDQWFPQPAWIVSALSPVLTVAQQWPGVLLGLGTNYRTADRATLEVRQDWSPLFTWVRPVTDATIARFAGVFASELASYRTANHLLLEVRVPEWPPAFSWLDVLHLVSQTPEEYFIVPVAGRWFVVPAASRRFT
jgi:hypothetical protein